MSRMSTLREIAVAKAAKQPGMADSITEDAPILNVCKWIPSTHGLWNVAERLDDVQGPGFVEPDAPLPAMSANSELVHTDLSVLGGMMEVPTQKALKFGGPEKYFADRQETLLRKAGMACERRLAIHNWLKAARDNVNLWNAGGVGMGWFMLGVRFDELLNVGLFDETQFDSGRLLKISMPFNGSEHYLRGAGYEGGVLGYSVAYRGNFGWQILDGKKTCAGIVNIDEDNKPTPAMIDDMLAQIRAQAGKTFIFCSPQAKIYGINPLKVETVQMVSSETDVKTMVDAWNGIPIITSYNFMERISRMTAGTRNGAAA